MLIAALSIFGMFALAGLAKLLTGDWLHPASIFCAFWGSVCAVAVIVAPEDVTSASGPLWILLNVAIVFICALAGAALACTTPRRRIGSDSRTICEMRPWSGKELRTLVVITTSLGFMYAVMLVGSKGLNIAELLSVRGLVMIASSMSASRYASVGQQISLHIQLLLAASFIAPLLGGTLFVCREKRLDTILSISTVFPSLLSFTTQSTKASVVFGLLMWAAGCMCSREFFGLPLCRLRKPLILLAVIAVPVSMSLIVVGAFLRTGQSKAGQIGESLISNHTKNYVCGHIGALSYWLDSVDLASVRPALGQYSFAGPYEAFHLATRAAGVMPENANLPTGMTNVYTYFRQLVEDFTAPGALLVIGAWGLLWGVAYRRTRERAKLWVGVLAVCYCAALLALTSLFNYNSTILAVFLYGLWWSRPWQILSGPTWAR